MIIFPNEVLFDFCIFLCIKMYLFCIVFFDDRKT